MFEFHTSFGPEEARTELANLGLGEPQPLLVFGVVQHLIGEIKPLITQ